MSPSLALFGVIFGALGAVTATAGAGMTGPCDIPPASSPKAEANKSPLRFGITKVQSTPEYLLTAPVEVESYIYTVTNCRTTVYIKTKTTTKNPFLEAVENIPGRSVGCRTLDGKGSDVTGTILRYFDGSIPRPVDVPLDWYTGNRMVFSLVYYSFPRTQSLTLRCGVDVPETPIGPVKIFSDVTATKFGCPESKWGTVCEQDCRCQNGGVCHTFEGSCSCTGNYDGVYCEIDIFNSTTLTSAPENVTGPAVSTPRPTLYIFDNELTQTTTGPANSSPAFTAGFYSHTFFIVVTLYTISPYIKAL